MTRPAPAETPATDAEAVARIARVAERHTGIRVQGAQRDRFRRAIRARMAEVDEPSIAAYAERVETEPAEWRRLVPAVAVGETLFFRDRARWASIRDHILPGLVRAAGDGPLRLWSAGCATGEEAWGLAMAYADRAVAGGPAAEVVGSDLNPEALAVARRAEYPERAMRGLTADEVARFFEPCPEGHRVRPEVRRMARFEELNLAEWAAAGPWPARFDLILCQHVLIYLSPAVTERVLTALARSLRPGGMLMVGHTETMTPPEGCALEWVGGSSGFRKPRVGAEAWVPREAPPPSAPDPDRLLEQAWDDVAAERYGAARRRLRALPRVGEALRLAAWIAVCGSDWDLARHLAERAVAADVAHPEAHFVAAMAALGAGRGEEAVRFLKRAVYLDPHFSVAHFHLAELEARRGHAEAARRAWRNAARASDGDGRRIRRYLGGFDAAALAQACEGRHAAGGSP